MDPEIPSSEYCEPMSPMTKTTQVETGPRRHTGAEVESTMYASFSREIRYRSVRGRMTLPTVRALK